MIGLPPLSAIVPSPAHAAVGAVLAGCCTLLAVAVRDIRRHRTGTPPAPAATTGLALAALPAATQDVLRYLKACANRSLYAPLDNRTLQQAVAAGGLNLASVVYEPHGPMAHFAVPEALWRSLPILAPAPGGAPWLKLR